MINDSNYILSNEQDGKYLQTFTGNFLITNKIAFYFIKLLKSFEIQLICKYFGFKFGQYADDIQKSYFKHVYSENKKYHFFLSQISCEQSSTHLDNCTFYEEEYDKLIFFQKKKILKKFIFSSIEI